MDNIYDGHFPVDATTWLTANTPTDLYPRVIVSAQISLAVNILNPLLYRGKALPENQSLVIATYTFLGTIFPVLQFGCEKHGIIVVAKSYDNNIWDVAVKANYPIALSITEDLFLKPPSDFLSFPQEFRFGPFSANNQQCFSFQLSDHSLHCLFSLISRQTLQKTC